MNNSKCNCIIFILSIVVNTFGNIEIFNDILSNTTNNDINISLG